MGNDRSEAARGPAKPGAPKPAARVGFGANTRRGEGPRLAKVEELGPLLDAITSQGDALMFARTSDGGAICITLLREKARDKAYASNQDELQAQVDWLKDEYLGG